MSRESSLRSQDNAKTPLGAAFDRAGAPQRVFWEHWPLLRKMATRRFNATGLAEDALNYLLERLAEDDWRKLRAYAGRASFKTYLAAVAGRLLEDFARSRFGRKRIPSWVKDRGGLWEACYRLLCWEGNSAEQCVELLAGGAPGGRNQDLIRETIAEVRRNEPDCGERTEVPDRPSEKDVTQSLPDSETGQPEQALLQAEKDAWLNELGLALIGELDAGSEDLEPFRQRADALRRRLDLKPRERLLLKMEFEDGMSVSVAARLLGMTTHQAHGIRRRLLARILEIFSCDIDMARG
jgi:RNA polymerase sigma factor (sigma-70 family)